MATQLNKAVFRETYTAVRDKGKRRILVAGLIVGDVIEVRLKGCRYSVQVPILWVWERGCKLRAEQLKRERKAKRAATRNMLSQLGLGA